MLLGLLALARAVVEPGEAEVAVGDEGELAARFGERQRVLVVGPAARGIKTGRDWSQCRRAGAEPGPRTRFDVARIQLRGRPGVPRRAGQVAGRRAPARGSPSRDCRCFPLAG
jgi:hypothetical protein